MSVNALTTSPVFVTATHPFASVAVSVNVTELVGAMFIEGV
jgi:hypothetical protein